MSYSRSIVKRFSKYWPLRNFYRAKILMPYFLPKLKLGFSWTRRKTENSNFYYDLTAKNTLELANFVSIVCGIDLAKAESYIREVREDAELRSHLQLTLHNDKSMRDFSPLLGRRIGWYAVVRAMKPKLVIETGVHQGVGAVTIITGLRKNTEEGFPGKYLGTDIDPKAGVLLKGKYLEFGELILGDSIESLERLHDKVDIFINDSNHSEIYEAREYQVISSKLKPDAIILGDNCHVTDALMKYSISRNRKFLLFKEEPKAHWYPGGGIGFSFK